MRLPEFVTALSPVGETLAAIQAGETAMETAVAEKNAQVCVPTAEEALALWEADYGLPIREGAEAERRRGAILAAMAGGRTLTPALIRELCVTLGGGDDGIVEEDFSQWRATVIAVGQSRVPADLTALEAALSRLKPAHLELTVLPGAEAPSARRSGLHGGVMVEVWA